MTTTERQQVAGRIVARIAAETRYSARVWVAGGRVRIYCQDAGREIGYIGWDASGLVSHLTLRDVSGRDPMEAARAEVQS